MKRIALATALLVGLAGPAWADFQNGWAAFERGDYASALREFKALAEQGDAAGQFGMGVLYHSGQGVPQDIAKAVELYRKAAEKGFSMAQANLGGMYLQGVGVAQNSIEGVKWYRLAADRGNADAQNNLGAMYTEGLGVPQDNVRAYMWFIIAVDQGHRPASKSRTELANQMTPTQTAEAEKLAREWMEKHGQ